MDQGEPRRLDARTGPRERSRRWWELAIAVVALALLVPWLARLTGFEPGPLAYLVALTPWFTLAWLFLLIVAASTRVWWLAGVVALPAVVSVGWASTMFLGAGPAPVGSDALTVATVNATYGRVDAAEVVAMVREREVDMLAVQELTPEVFGALAQAGLDEELPFSEAVAEPGVTGTGLWSRLPFEASEPLAGFTSDAAMADYVSWAVRGEVEAAGEAVTVVAVHPAAPGPFDHASWEASMRHLSDYAAGLSGPVLVMGDFNTTRDHAAFRALEADGFRDAADDAGAGFLFTFPEGRLPLPVVAIDHVIARDVDWTASSVETVSLSGADHRALVVTYAVG